MANNSLFDALISFTPSIPAGHLPFFFSFLHTKERSELVFIDKAFTLCVSPARVWKMACGWCPHSCLSWLCWWFQVVSLAFPPSSPLSVPSQWLLLRDPLSRWCYCSSHLSKVLLQMLVASSCPCAPTTDKPSRYQWNGLLSVVFMASSMLLSLLIYNLKNNEVKRTRRTVLNKGCPHPEWLSGRVWIQPLKLMLLSSNSR